MLLPGRDWNEIFLPRLDCGNPHIRQHVSLGIAENTRVFMGRNPFAELFELSRLRFALAGVVEELSEQAGRCRRNSRYERVPGIEVLLCFPVFFT